MNTNMNEKKLFGRFDVSKKRIFEIIQLSNTYDNVEKAFDIFIALTIAVNLFVTIFGTFNESLPYKDALYVIEGITVFIFIIEYALRLWTVEYLYPEKERWAAVLKYMTSFFGLLDFVTIVVFFLPLASSGVVAFRMLRMARVFNLFKVNNYNDSFKVITDVLYEKKSQITSSVFIILILMVASSLLMYSIESTAQPEVFENAFSGIWWSMSTLLTVGYGDIYPITTLGRLMAIVIAFLGVGLVAIPTGIISAGFVEQQTRMKTREDYMEEAVLRFVVIHVNDTHPYVGKQVKDLNIPPGLIMAVVIRDEEVLLPKGDMSIMSEDKLVIGAEAYKDDLGISLKEVILKDKHPWIGHAIKDLDISRKTLIIAIKRRNRIVIPHGNTRLQKQDMLFVYSKKDIDEILDGIDVDL